MLLQLLRLTHANRLIRANHPAGFPGMGRLLAKGIPPTLGEPITSLNGWCQLRWPLNRSALAWGASWLIFIVLGGKHWLVVDFNPWSE